MHAVRVLGTFLSAFAVCVSAAEADESQDITLTFGVYQTDKASVMYRQFTPIIKQLENELQERANRSARIHVVIFKTYSEANDALVAGEVDFVRFGPASYVIAKNREPGLSLLAMEQKDGERRFCGVIVVRTDSPIENLADLAGKRFAFGDENSTIGRYLAQAELVKAGVHARDLTHYEYLGRHDLVAKAVSLGDFDAGSIKENTFAKLAADGKLRVLLKFDNVTKPWIARAGLDPELVEHLKESLLAVDDADALKSLKFSGFVPASDEDYQFVREGMCESGRFDD